MTSRCRYFCRRLLQMNRYYYPIVQLPKLAFGRIAVPCTLGFSMFTWLGFNKKLSAEDELIKTIKHCVLFTQRGEYEKAEQLLHVALRQAQQMRNESGITYIYDIMANLALEREQLDKAKQLFVAVTQRIMAEGAKEDDPRVIHISAKLARISHLKKEYSTAKLGYDWCLSKLKNLPPEALNEIEKLIAMTEDWYGRLLVDYEKSNKGLDLMVSSLNRMEKLDVEKEHIVIQMNDIATVCDQLEKYDEGISYLLQAIEVGKQLPDMDELGAVYVNLGRLYMKKMLLDKARKSCGAGWKLGVTAKNDDIKREAELCFKEIKNLS
ncbi:PREDICTED: tetratricopeptide repeat protein 19 homolog, mitochondrial [Papilio xuthus]|uniref:Tetratricopeptide repeat protein 19 homolog, mitochondrial n=1 Tax=Papilio xuthus TaxID=66420 RepID=A0AAJ6Z0R5_PAPXU|nr:PREDICTED: tetratricopeptide repeat protein 19 homolog, mitochondrial [Papilio xuthus]